MQLLHGLKGNVTNKTAVVFFFSIAAPLFLCDAEQETERVENVKIQILGNIESSVPTGESR